MLCEHGPAEPRKKEERGELGCALGKEALTSVEARAPYGHGQLEESGSQQGLSAEMRGIVDLGWHERAPCSL